MFKTSYYIVILLCLVHNLYLRTQSIQVRRDVRATGPFEYNYDNNLIVLNKYTLKKPGTKRGAPD